MDGHIYEYVTPGSLADPWLTVPCDRSSDAGGGIICWTGSGSERSRPIRWGYWLTGWIPTLERPVREWYETFSGLVVSGRGELARTFLRRGRVPGGNRID